MKAVLIAVLVMAASAGAEMRNNVVVEGDDNVFSENSIVSGNKAICLKGHRNVVKGNHADVGKRPAFCEVRDTTKKYGRDVLKLHIGCNDDGSVQRLVGFEIIRDGKTEFTWEE